MQQNKNNKYVDEHTVAQAAATKDVFIGASSVIRKMEQLMRTDETSRYPPLNLTKLFY